MSNDDFYIGWQDHESPAYRRYFLGFFGLTLFICLGFAGVFATVERGFIDSYFDYGNLTELQGRLVLEPAPGIIINDNGQRKTVPLVGFGKFGAAPVLQDLQTKLEGDISDYEVTISGTIFAYRDKQWMELTEGKESIVSWERATPLERTISEVGTMEFEGEIVDPKCFFGVMNPATKAVHRSCAIRCISGGVPPVLGLRREGQFVDYYFVTDENLQPINQSVLKYVGLPVQLTGTVVVYDDWKVLQIDPAMVRITSDQTGPLGGLTLCSAEARLVTRD